MATFSLKAENGYIVAQLKELKEAGRMLLPQKEVSSLAVFLKVINAEIYKSGTTIVVEQKNCIKCQVGTDQFYIVNSINVLATLDEI